MKQELLPKGSDLKILVDVSELGEDIVLGNIAYSLEFTSGDSKKTFDVTIEDEEQSLPAGLKVLDENRVVAAIKGSELDRGDVWLRAILSIPDEDFTDGIRVEIHEIDQHITIF
ncbi:MAG: hypothetical protein IJU69_00225 [Bacteroidales bacterium]|nr:hypothetical protein [Bacteroidales bacterium]